MAGFRTQPYVKALEEVLQETGGDLDEAAAKLKLLAEAFGQAEGVNRLFTAPTLSQEAKSRTLDTILSRAEISGPVARFVHVVQRHYRLEHLAKLAEAFQAQADRRAGRVRATVQVPGSMDDSQRQRLLEALTRTVGAEVRAEFVTDPALLAGFKARIGSTVVDGSLSGQLDRLASTTTATDHQG